MDPPSITILRTEMSEQCQPVQLLINEGCLMYMPKYGELSSPPVPDFPNSILVVDLCASDDWGSQAGQVGQALATAFSLISSGAPLHTLSLRTRYTCMEQLLQLLIAGAGASACASVRTLHIGIMDCDQWPGELWKMQYEGGCAHLTVDLLGGMLLGCFPNVTTLHFLFPQHFSVERLIALFPKLVSLSLGNSVVVADPYRLSECLCLKDLDISESLFSLHKGGLNTGKQPALQVERLRVSTEGGSHWGTWPTICSLTSLQCVSLVDFTWEPWQLKLLLAMPDMKLIELVRVQGLPQKSVDKVCMKFPLVQVVLRRDESDNTLMELREHWMPADMHWK